MLTSLWQKAQASNPNGACLEARWVKASASNPHGSCLEACWAGGMVEVRDSKHRRRNLFARLLAAFRDSGTVLRFTPAEWSAFLDGAGKGEFDLPAA
jgi:Domain of unknown function (DUF397)